MHSDIFKLVALVFSCLFYVGVIGWCFRGVLGGAAERLLSGWGALSPFGRMAVLFFAGVAIVYGGWKPQTNGTDGVSFPAPCVQSTCGTLAMAPVIQPLASDSDGFSLPTGFPPVTNLCFWGIARDTDSVSLGLAWPASLSFVNGCIDLYGSRLLVSNGWALLAEVDVSEARTNAVVRLELEDLPSGLTGGTAFYRAADQTDADGDGVSDAYERLVAGCSPETFDSDGDGLGDGEEVVIGTCPTSEDSDGDGLSDAAETGKIEVVPVPGAYWQSMSSHREITTGSSYSNSGSYVFELPHPYTVNGVTYTQVRLCADGVVYLLNPDRPNWSYRLEFSSPPSLASDFLCENHVAIAAFCTDLYLDAALWRSAIVCGSAYVDWRPVNVIDVYRIGFESDRFGGDRHLFSYQLVLPSEEENVFYLTYMVDDAEYCASRNPTIGVQIPMLPPRFADERYYHLTWKPTAGSFERRLCLKFTVGRGTDPTSDDTDGDGFSDTDEIVVLGTDPRTPDGDTDADGLPDAMELRTGTDPELGDSDCDGLDDLEEFGLGTDPLQPDSDGDGMNDGWEARYDGQTVQIGFRNGPGTDEPTGMPIHFDPLVNNDEDVFTNNDSDADPDRDGLTNAEECARGSNPCRADTDRDGVDDAVEAGQGSDPMDPTDGGVAGSRVGVSFYFGDHSGSHSEKYRLTVTPVRGVGTTPSSFGWLNEHYGECETNTAFLKPGWHYEVRLAHAGTKPGESTDYDYTLLQFGVLPPNVIITDDDSLFGVDETSSSFAGAGKVAHVYVVGKPRLVFDYDRNGRIDEDDVARARAGATFRFWINDDNDSGDTNDSANDRPGSGSNYSDGLVNGRGDLLDFTPVWMDFSDVFPPGTPAQVWDKIEWRIASGCVNVVWSNLGREDAGLFQREGDLYEFGQQLCDLAEIAGVRNVYDGVAIPDALRGTSETEGGVFLIEGCALGFDLTLEGWTANRPSSEQECLVAAEADICITGVEDMYRSVSLRGAANDPALTVNVPGCPTNLPDDTTDIDVFFTHGFNVDAADARAWGSEVFKRLWQSGSNANFHLLPWRGDYSWLPGNTFNGLHYQHDVWFAQRTGGAMKRYVEAAQPVAARRILMTQSLGNMVACEALREGLQVGKFFMFDAAVPSEAIDETLRAENAEDAPFPKYVPSEWYGYTNACWAANWHQFFEDDSTDARGKMGWSGRYADALTNATEVFNYYSSGDDVFKEFATVPSRFDGLDESLEMYCWQKQETLKGAAVLAGTAYGGWAFHSWTVHELVQDIGGSSHYEDRTYRYSPEDAARMIADGSIVENAVFNRDFSPMFDRNASQDDEWLAVAKYVPAVSSPVGGREMGRVENNVDMDKNSGDGGVPRPNLWGRDSPDWQHSDMKDMAYFYVYKLYEQLIQKGGLK